jgi:penicillin-binding protein 2
MFEFPLSKELKGKRVKIFSKEELEPQEIFLDSLAQKKEEELGNPERKIETPLPRKSLILILFLTFLLIFLLFLRTLQLQIFEGKHYLLLAQENKYLLAQIKSVRGIIYDRNFEQLVFNQPSFDLIYQKNNFPEKEKVFKEVSQILKIDFNELKEKIEKSETPKIVIRENLDLETLIILETRKKDLPGFEIEKNFVRIYPDGPTFSQVIGYYRKTGEKMGLEQSYDEFLKEKPGEILVERDARGNLISQKVLSYPQSGDSLVLWLDSKLQRKIEEELNKKIKELGAKGGAGVALDPKTGGVLALVSLPSFDNNLFSQGMSEEEWKKLAQDPSQPLFNWAIAGGYPTGSAIKPLIALAGLEEGIISPKKEIHCQGEIQVTSPWNPKIKWRFGDWKVHGWTDLKKAIAESCNIYFYHLGGGYGNQEGLGPSRIKKYLSLFGWGKKTGIDLPGEEDGFLPDPDWKKEKLGQNWYDGDTYHLSIGQGYLRVTPLQMAVSFLPLANDGKLLKPKLVQKIVDSQGNLIKESEPEIIRENFIKKENLEIVRQGMRQAVTNGTATGWLDQLPVAAGAKTGSAQTGKKDPSDQKDYLDTWIVVFAPYEDPKIVLTLMIKNVKEGQVTVLPVAKAILEWYFSQGK